MTIQPVLKPEWKPIILEALKELTSKPDPGLDIWEHYYNKVQQNFNQPLDEDSYQTKAHLEISRPQKNIQQELLSFFIGVRDKIIESDQESLDQTELGHHILLLHRMMGAELELPAHILDAKLNPSPKKTAKKKIEEDCIHLLNRLCNRDWNNELTQFHHFTLTQQVEEEASRENFEPDASAVSSHLFTGALTGALVLCLPSQWLSIPLLLSGFVIIYLWAVRETKFMMAFLTSLSCGLSAFTLWGSHPLLGETLLTVLEITSGTLLGGMIGLYYGYLRWHSIRDNLSHEFYQERLKKLVEESIPNLPTLHQFLSQFIQPHFHQAKTAVASLLNEAFSSKDECDRRLVQIRNQNPKPDFDEYFEVHKLRNDHESRIRELERLYGAFQLLESRLGARIGILTSAMALERFQILSGTPGDMDHLYIDEKEFSATSWKRKLDLERIALVINWLSNFRPFLEFELSRSTAFEPEQWINRLPEELGRGVA